MQETWVRSLCWEDPLEEEMATHSSILAWKIPLYYHKHFSELTVFLKGFPETLRLLLITFGEVLSQHVQFSSISSWC